ncbi:zinc metalloprotease HtpX [Candidatus Woesearchaeota archaeon]|nr:MAG: zinc metalloprotease HtpX [Candidatus Woesearchaeota archaeon]
MADFYEEISKNKLKSYALMVFFSLLIIVLGYVFGEVFLGDYMFGMVFAFIIAIIYSLIAYHSGSNMILSLSHAKPVTKKDDPFYWNTVEGLSIAAGIPMPKIYMIQEESINAFATGKDPEHSAVCITSGARKRLNRAELEGVLAHEISHIKNYDIRFMMLVTVMIGIVALLSDFMLRSFLWGGGRRDSKSGGNVILIVVALAMAILAPIIAQMIRFAISRKREFLADASGAKLTRYPKGLADALRKIKNDHDKVVDTANKATAHLYIENPLRNLKGGLNRMFSTHPPIDERIKALESM